MSTAAPPREALERFQRDLDAVRAEVRKVIVGHEPIVDGVITCLLAGGNALLEGVPGLGKTMLVRTLGQVLDLRFARIQFTPDLMPADILGTQVTVDDPGGGKRFEFQRGAIFANLVLADEINRATPKTQSALLEVMEERCCTVDGVTHRMEEPFQVLATMNPVEHQGTYPLPEAQLDRFICKIVVGYSKLDDLITILDRTTGQDNPDANKVLDGPPIMQAQ